MANRLISYLFRPPKSELAQDLGGIGAGCGAVIGSLVGKGLLSAALWAGVGALGGSLLGTFAGYLGDKLSNLYRNRNEYIEAGTEKAPRTAINYRDGFYSLLSTVLLIIIFVIRFNKIGPLEVTVALALGLAFFIIRILSRSFKKAV